MDLRFPEYLQVYVDDMLANGSYDTVYDLIVDAISIHRDAELTRRRKYEELKKEIQIGLDQLDRGEVVDGPQTFDRILAELGETDVKREAS
jgi:antitoxin ParD1/3/4